MLLSKLWHIQITLKLFLEQSFSNFNEHCKSWQRWEKIYNTAFPNLLLKQNAFCEAQRYAGYNGKCTSAPPLNFTDEETGLGKHDNSLRRQG